MVSMDVSNSENQFDWLEGSRYGSNCQKIHSTDVAEFKKPVQATKLFERNNLEIQEFRLQFQRFFAQRDKFFWVCSNKTQKRIRVRKVHKRTPPYLNIYQRCYRPGSYALRGVIDQVYVFRWGLPFFSWLFLRRKLWIYYIQNQVWEAFNCYVHY